MNATTHLTMVALDELVDDVQAWRVAGAGPDDTFTYIDLGSIGESKTISEPRIVRCEDAPSRARQIVREKDVLVSTVRPNLNGVAAVPRELDGAIASTGFCVLRPRQHLLDSRYLFQWVKSPVFVSNMTRRATGASYPAVTDATVRESRIPVPPLPEQRRIAAILDKTNELQSKRRATSELLKELTQALFFSVFGDPIRSGSAPLTNVGRAIADGVISAIQDGNHGERHPKASDFAATGIPFVTANALIEGELRLSACSQLPPSWLKRLRVGFAAPGDVLLSHKGSVGLTAIVPQTETPLLLSPQVTYYRPNTEHLLPEFLQAFFATTSFQQVLEKDSQQTTRAYVGITRQLELPILVPPIARQQEFADRLRTLKEIRLVERKASDLTDSLFDSLRSRAFVGEL